MPAASDDTDVGAEKGKALRLALRPRRRAVSSRRRDRVRYWAILLLFCGLAAAPAAAHPPYGLVADAAGNAYFSDLQTVWRLSPEGRLSVFRAVPDTHVHAIALAPDGAIEGDQNHYDPETQRF